MRRDTRHNTRGPHRTDLADVGAAAEWMYAVLEPDTRDSYDAHGDISPSHRSPHGRMPILDRARGVRERSAARQCLGAGHRRL